MITLETLKVGQIYKDEVETVKVLHFDKEKDDIFIEIIESFLKDYYLEVSKTMLLDDGYSEELANYLDNSIVLSLNRWLEDNWEEVKD